MRLILYFAHYFVLFSIIIILSNNNYLDYFRTKKNSDYFKITIILIPIPILISYSIGIILIFLSLSLSSYMTSPLIPLL